MHGEELVTKRDTNADRRDMQMQRGVEALQQISDRGFAYARLRHQTLDYQETRLPGIP